MTLWHKANAVNARRSKWIFSRSAGSNELFFSIDSSEQNPEQINEEDLGENVDRIERLTDLVPRDLDAPVAVVVESDYPNLDGVYRRQSKVHIYFPVYYNADSALYLWYNLFRSEWVCSDVIGGKRYMWKVPSSDPRALSPSTSDLRKIRADSKITAIRDAESVSTSSKLTGLKNIRKTLHNKLSSKSKDHHIIRHGVLGESQNIIHRCVICR